MELDAPDRSAGPDLPASCPSQRQFVAFEFVDEETKRCCYEYVAANAGPILPLHRAKNSKVERGSAMFFVCAEARAFLNETVCAVTRSPRRYAQQAHASAWAH